MRLLIVGLTLGLSALLTTAQQPARIGPDGKPLLNRPILEECKKSKDFSIIIVVSQPGINFIYERHFWTVFLSLDVLC